MNMTYREWCESIGGCRAVQRPVELAQPVLGGFDSATIPTGYSGGGLFPPMAIPNAVPEALMLEAMALQSSPQSLMGGGFDTVMAPTGYFDSGNFALGF